MIKDAATGEGIAGAHIKVKNVTSGRNQEIDHDVVSGELETSYMLTPLSILRIFYRSDYSIINHFYSYSLFIQFMMVNTGGLSHQASTK